MENCSLMVNLPLLASVTHFCLRFVAEVLFHGKDRPNNCNPCPLFRTLAARAAPFADKHQIWVGFHNHTNNLPEMDKFDSILDLGQYIGFNLDLGHYAAGTKGKSPIPVLEKYHARITNLHLKDRTADGGNVPWGQGQTPIKEVLQLMKK